MSVWLPLGSETSSLSMDPALVPPANQEEETARLLSLFLAGRSAATLTAYRRDLEDFRQFVAVPTAAEAAEKLLLAGQGNANLLTLAYRNHLLERHLSPATINRRLSALRALVKLARMVGMVPWTLEVPQTPSTPYRDTRGPGRDAFRLLLAALGEADTTTTRRDRALLRLLYDLGLRRGEVVSLDVEDLDLNAKTLRVLGKRRTEKEILSLASSTADALSAWLEARPGAPTGPLFINFDRARKGDGRLTSTYVYLIVQRLGNQIGIKVSPHGLRHTAITEACKAAQAAGIGLEEVLQFSRHKNVNVLMIYRDRERDVQGQLAALVAEQV
jgi:integrase/recombinase XerC